MTRQAGNELRAVNMDGTTERRLKLTASFDNEGEAQFFVLGLGSGARVLAPEGFRERIVAEVEATSRG
jgi:predicted DNA-binding transcriptional regulator YafY